MTEHVNMSIAISTELARRIDLLAAAEQQTVGPIKRITRSGVVRAILEKHLADAPAAPAQPAPRWDWSLPPVRTRVRRRKPAGD